MKKKLFKKVGITLLSMTLVISLISGCGTQKNPQKEGETQGISLVAEKDQQNQAVDKENLGKEEAGSKEQDKGDQGKEDQGKEDQGKEDQGKEDQDKEDQGKEDQDKEDPDKGNQDKEGQDKSLPALAVDGTQLVDEAGNAVQLRGLSTHGLAWFPGYVNEAFFKELKETWKINVVRLAMYTHENGGYCAGGNQDKLKSLIKDGVEYATANDLYVIIDWHVLNEQDPNKYKKEAKTFFEEMSKLYADYTNVIYEICNEPNGGTTWKDIKSYAEEVIPVIRKNDENAVILVGTPNWSQYVDRAARDPIKGYDNIMYTLHFYAATHTDWLRNNMVNAIKDGLPIFVSEFGICDASGSGEIDEYQAEKWIEVMNDYGVSYVAWNISNKSETSAIFKNSCSKFSGFAESDLSANGKWLFKMFSGDSKFVSSQVGGDKTGQNGDQSTGQDQTGSGDQSNGQAQGTGQGDGQDQGTGQGQTTSQGNLTVQVAVANSWESEGKVFLQYSLSIANNASSDAEDWSIQLEFTNDIAFSDGWNAKFSANGDTLTICPVNYNATIGAGGSIADIGFILSGPVGTELVTGE